MTLRIAIKSFEFCESNRSKIILGSKTRLDPVNQYARLKLENDGYPTDDDLYIKTWIFNPNAVKSWVGFDVVVEHGKDIYNELVTSLGFRISDGSANQYYWDGNSWEVSATEWSTEDEIATNISSFPATTKKIQIIVNLVTTDESKTPILKEIRVSYQANFEFTEDLIVRTLIPTLKQNIRPTSDYLITTVVEFDKLSLADTYIMENPYDITSIVGVYNHADDPDHFDNLYQSYDPSTKVITLTETIDAGTLVWIEFSYQPLIALSTDRDYIEADKAPAIHITSIDTIREYKSPGKEYTRDKTTGRAFSIQLIHQNDVEITLTMITGLQKDQVRMGDKVEEWIKSSKKLKSYGLDEEFDIQLSSPYKVIPAQREEATYAGFLKLIVLKALSYHQVLEEHIVQRMILSGDIETEI